MPMHKLDAKQTASQLRRAAGLPRAAMAGQQGAAILIVMVVMLLGALLVAWSSRAALFSERVTGNEADYLLAFEAAQAMLVDAELDALGTMADGSACQPGCRRRNSALLQVPQSFSLLDSDGGDMLVLARALQDMPVPCRQGLCLDDGRMAERFWLNADELRSMQAEAALYGEFTGAVQDASMGNSRLLVTALMRADRTQANAWYWIEPLEFSANSATGQRYAPIGQGVGMTSINGIVYRITAVARGRKPGTLAIVQSILVPQAKAVVAARLPSR